MMFMGSKNITQMMFYVLLSPLFIPWTLAMDSGYNPQFWDDFIHDYAQKVVKRPHTGTLYNISLPRNFCCAEVSFVRLRSGSFWIRGRNSSLIQIPPRIIPLPYVKRLDIVYQNLGNWSSYYYNVPNYTFVAPVIGFTTYGADDANSSSNPSPMLTLSLRGDPILIRFPNISLKDGDNVTMKCVRFGANGTVEFSNVTVPNLCNACDQGHFSIVIPSFQLNSPTNGKRREKLWKWWVTGVGGLILLVLFGILVCKMVRVKRIESMEKNSEKSEALDTVWVGRSRMPSASGIRTQPVLEDDWFP